MCRTICIMLTEESLPLIGVLNGGIEPSIEAAGNYFLCDIDGPETTSNHRFLTPEEFHPLAMIESSATLVYHLKK